MRAQPLFLALGVLLLGVGCSTDSVSTYSPAGQWFGADAVVAPYPVLEMALAVQGATVTGTGTLDATPRTITGSYDAAAGHATLTLASTTRPAVTYRVTAILPASMGGTLTGGSYAGHPLFVDRR